jgi:hypothetical protein
MTESRIIRNGRHWDGETVGEHDVLRMIGRGPGGSLTYQKGTESFKRSQTEKRKLRRIRAEPRKRAEKQKQQEEEQVRPVQLKEDRQHITAINFQGKSYTAKTFSHVERLEKGLWREFHRWVKEFSGIPRWSQKFVDQDTETSQALGRFSNPQLKGEYGQPIGKIPVLLDVDERWRHNQRTGKRRNQSVGVHNIMPKVSPQRVGIRELPVRAMLKGHFSRLLKRSEVNTRHGIKD